MAVTDTIETRGAIVTKIFTSAALAIALLVPETASAGVFGDDLSRCLVEKASESDQRSLKRWMFSAFSADPALASLANITPKQRTAISSEAANVYNRLLLLDCRKQALAALKNEGTAVMGPAFGVLGRSVANGIFRSPAAEAELDKLASFFDETALNKLFEEAGIKVDAK
jgi:hypothetical protein